MHERRDGQADTHGVNLLGRSTLPQAEAIAELGASAALIGKPSPEAQRRMLFDMRVIQAAELELLALAADGRVHGPLHTSLGQESVAVGLLRHLMDGDRVVGSHRSHHHFLAQGLNRVLPAGWDVLSDDWHDGAQSFLNGLFAEIIGGAAGTGRGAGGSMHLRDDRTGFEASTAIVGGGLPIAAGLALAAKREETDNVVVAFVGDGAVNQGVFHEAANLAAVLHLPLLIVVENNGYAEATTPDEASAALPLAARGNAYGLSTARVVADDILAVDEVAERLVAAVRATGEPALLEVETYRHLDHAGPRPGSDAGYRSRAEELAWRERDPIVRLPHRLRELGLLSPDDDELISSRAREVVARASAWARADDSPQLLVDERALLRGPEPTVTTSAPDTARLSGLTFREAIADVVAGALESSDVMLIGEEVGKPGGLLAQADRLDLTRLGTQVIDTPISEAGFVGMACGAAMAGLRPLVELMYGSFTLVAADQLFNHVGMVRALYGNTASAPVVVRTKVPVGRGFGPQHSLNPVGLFRSFPGWRVHAPADPVDYAAVMAAALTGDDPVLIVEFTELYDLTCEIRVDGDDTRPSGLRGARVLRQGGDVTLVSYGLGVHWALDAAAALEQEEVQAEVVDLRALDALSMDYDLLHERLNRTGRVVFVDPGARSQSIGTRLAAELVEGGGRFRWSTVACGDVTPVARALELQSLAGADEIVSAALALVRT